MSRSARIVRAARSAGRTGEQAMLAIHRPAVARVSPKHRDRASLRPTALGIATPLLATHLAQGAPPGS